MGDRWRVRLGRGSWVKRSRFKWAAKFGPLPDDWDVHHLDPGTKLDDEPLIGTLALPRVEHQRYHHLKDRQAAEDILTRWFFYWADRIAGHGSTRTRGPRAEPCHSYLKSGRLSNTKSSTRAVYHPRTDRVADLGLARSKNMPGGARESP